MHIMYKSKNKMKLSAGVLYEIRRKVEVLADYHDCSKSFVVNTILAEKLGIKLEETIYDYRPTARNSRRKA